MRQDTINVHQNYNIKPKADCITKTIPNFNLDYNLINEASRVDVLNNDSKPKAENVRLATEAEVVIQSNNENIKINVLDNNLEPLDAEGIEQANCKVDILTNNIGPKANDCFSYHDDKIIIVSNKIEPRANGIEETKSNLNLQPGKNNKIEIAYINIKDEAEEVKGTDIDINLSPDEDIKVNVPEINNELLYENLKVRFPDMFLEPFESVKVNFEKTIIAAQNLKHKEDFKTPSAVNVVKDNCKSEIECNTTEVDSLFSDTEPKASHNFDLEYKNDGEINILGNNIGPKAENFKQAGAMVSVKVDEGCKINNTNNNIKPPASIIVESDKGKGLVNKINSNLQPKATSIVETRSKSRSNKNVNLNCSKLVTEPKASDVNNKSKLIGQDNKKVKLDVKNIKLKPKAKSMHDINEIVKVKTSTYDEITG
ncbi:unnamed protein product [Rotaria magnacalcarata]|uniref:Uncharacterized protein n=1 Tax=Rotaria magnacalcarata TaxID=392030 RepID=A0A820LCP1_9BILA|nr:unnamed protein product [Rotaria magnacalcarata]